MLIKEIIGFLKEIPPFNLLGEDILEQIAEKVSVEYYPRGFTILSQNGPPCSSLKVIKKGGAKVFMKSTEGNEVAIDYRSEGDAFGYVSLISGDKSRAYVIAVEDTICYAIPKDAILNILEKEPLVGDYFMKSFFVNFIDRTYREMRERNLVFGEGDKLLFTTPVKGLISKDAVTARAGVSIREAAGMMSKFKISSLILVDRDDVPVGIITDRDLRDKVVARGIDPADPVDKIMSPPLIRSDSSETCFEALVKMVHFNIHHLLVVEGGRLKGVVTNTDFMLLQGTSPLSLVKYIESQKHVEGIIPIHEKINQIISILFKEGVKAVHIMRIITELNDRLLRKIVELSIKEIGDPPRDFAFIFFGSEGRKEQTFKTELDCAIVFEDPRTPLQNNDMEDYCMKLLSHLQDILTKCGMPRLTHHPLGRQLPLYSGLSSWEKTIITALRSSDTKSALNARTFLDMRLFYGNADLVTSLRHRIYKETNESRVYIGTYLDWVQNQSSPLGFFKQFVVDRDGEHKDELNIKEKGILPIVDALRVLAVAYEAEEHSTMERLDVISAKNRSLSEMHTDLSSAFEFLLHLRLQDQLRKTEFHDEIDDFIEPEKLSLLEKKTLKEIFQLIPRLQTLIEDYYLKRDTVAI